ncbi:MAG: glucose-6-phosphate isomerase [Cellvibrionaceae bacterium]
MSEDNIAKLSNVYTSWEKLIREQERWRNRTLLEEFESDPNRAAAFSRTFGTFFLDFSKNHLTESSFQLLLTLTQEAKLTERIESLFKGDIVNTTEQRKALHVALRSPNCKTEEEIAVQETLAKMSKFVDAIHTDTWLGFSNQPIKDIVHIGIGGSDLGPRMVTNALQPFHLPHTKVHFIANIDGADIESVLAPLSADTTLFIVASKSFTTLETLENALSAREWLMSKGCEKEDVAKHFVSITANINKAIEFGIAQENLFPMWDWVGGRYSLWSAIGLPIALSIGMKEFKKLLTGANKMDEHFRNAPPQENLPVIQALIAFWYSQFWGASSQVILPYNHLLEFFPAFLQQLDMESLGKSTNLAGEKIDYSTGLVIWGTEGTNGQHSFHQLLHQGTQLIPADFIICKKAQHTLTHQQEHLFACCLSQSQALMTGKGFEQAKKELIDSGTTEEKANELAQHKIVPGNRPSTSIVMNELTPESLGSLIAMYEHKVFTLSVLLNINAFDQWGVELGKQLGTPIHSAIVASKEEQKEKKISEIKFDSSTQQLIDLFKQ